jgi:hypothetical protein
MDLKIKDIINSRVFLASLVALAAVAVYLPAASGGFAWDDLNIFMGRSDYVPFFESQYQRPVFDALMSLDYRLWGGNPVGFHVTNILLHGACSVLVFILGVYFFERTFVSFLAALLFALHPANTEAVAWVSARGALLVTMFFISAFILYIHYRKGGKTSALVASALFFLLAVLSGQSALVFPVIVLAYELCVKPRQRRKLLLYTGLLALCFSAFWSFFGSPGEFHPAGGLQTGRLFDSFSALGYYVGKLAFPVNLNLLPGIPENPLLLFIALMPLVLAAVLYTEGRKTGAFLAAWIPVTVLPALLVVMAGVEFPLGQRYLYLPSVGACMLLAFFAGGIRSQRTLAACFIPILAFCIAGTSGRVQTWRSDTAIWEDTALKSPEQVLPLVHQGISLIKAGRLEEGKEALRAAMGHNGITQDDMLLIAKVLHNAGGQDGDEALFENLAQARGGAEAYYGLGFMYYRLYAEDRGRPALLRKSIEYLEKAVAASSDFMRPHYYLGLCYLEANDWQRAEEHLKIARRLDIDGQYKTQTGDFLTLISETRKRGL